MLFSSLASRSSHSWGVINVCASFYFIALVSCLPIRLKNRDVRRKDVYWENSLHFYFGVWRSILLPLLLSRVACVQKYTIFIVSSRCFRSKFLWCRCSLVGRSCSELQMSFSIAKGILQIWESKFRYLKFSKNVSRGFLGLWSL